MQDNRRLTTLADELALCRQYLNLEQLRLGERLQVDWDVQTMPGDALVPQLLLQPLVENAVSHGISNLTEGGWIRLSIGGDGRGDLTIVLENSFDREMPSRRGTGMGLKNVRRRLDMRYGDRANFDVRTEGDCFRVTMNLPAEKAAAGPAEKDDAER